MAATTLGAGDRRELPAPGADQPAGLSTAQAMRSPLLPEGSVTLSSSPAWITSADPSASRNAAKLAPVSTTVSRKVPLAATGTLGRSPACGPCGLDRPCLRDA